MLAALNLGALLISVAAGGLTASLVGLIVGGALSLTGLDNGPDIGLVTGVFAGLATGGWIAGARSRHSHRFHGMVSGLLQAFVIVIIARLGGSPASTPTVLWLALLAIVIGGLFGWLAGRRKTGTAST